VFQQIGLMITAPPYGVDYDPAMRSMGLMMTEVRLRVERALGGR
jgi:hypothetical protein